MDDGTYKPLRVSVSILYLYIFLYFLNKNLLNLNLNLNRILIFDIWYPKENADTYQVHVPKTIIDKPDSASVVSHHMTNRFTSDVTKAVFEDKSETNWYIESRRRNIIWVLQLDKRDLWLKHVLCL